jgi:hypothetical protein
VSDRKDALRWGEEQSDRRGHPRFRLLDLEAMLESDLFYDSVRLVNLGRLGFSVRSFIAYPTGTAVRLRLADYPIFKARVIWCTRGQLGARFDEPLAEGTLLSLILAEPQPNRVQTDTVPTAPLRPAPARAPHHDRQEASHHRLPSRSAS